MYAYTCGRALREQVYAEIERTRFVAGGAASRGMLGALVQAHSRPGRSKREGYGTSWRALASLAAVLGHDSCLTLALPHLHHAWDQVSWAAESTAVAHGDANADPGGMSGVDANACAPCPPAASSCDSALLRA